jgi:hypothetical protein
MVELGRDVPSWELKRWGRDTLRFNPLSGDKYTLRGNGGTLVYRGERQNHRFTILDGERFEYDVILKREPESRTLYFEISGWEEFDFFRQPDAFGPELLRGSYAVYKKEFVISGPRYNVGTGKICHIHRPLVWDAQGKKVWGDIRVDKGILTLSIPEGWLAGAKYPVTVDPVIGNSSVGAYYQYPYMDGGGLESYLEGLADGCYSGIDDWDEYYDICLDEGSLYNRVSVPLPMQGNYDAYFYVNGCDYSRQYPNEEVPIHPFLYNNASANKPKNPLISASRPAESRTGSAYPKGFRKGGVTVSERINAGTSVWFGFSGWGYTQARFDYGSPFYYAYYRYFWDDEGYPFNQLLRQSEMDDLSNSATRGYYLSGDNEYNVAPGARFDFKVSMYLQISNEAYTRTITQGVSLSDRRGGKYEGKRSVIQNAGISQTLNRIQAVLRKVEQGVAINGECVKKWDIRKVQQDGTEARGIAVHEKGIFRFIENTFMAVDMASPVRSIMRMIGEIIPAYLEAWGRREIRRGVGDGLCPEDAVTRSRGLFAFLAMHLGIGDSSGYRNDWGRKISDTADVPTDIPHKGTYRRGLPDVLANSGEAGRAAEYLRFEREEGRVFGEAARSLGVFIRLLTAGLIRDYVIRRFLKAREELVLKSPVCREIVLESRILGVGGVWWVEGGIKS